MRSDLACASVPGSTDVSSRRFVCIGPRAARAVTHPYLDLSAGLPPDAAALLVKTAVAYGSGARRTARRSASSTTATVVSNKMSEAFAAESGHEAEALLLADVAEGVAAFRPQPVAVRYWNGDRMANAFPDIGIVLLGGGVELWEVKPERRDDDLVRRLGHLASALRGHGITYRVRTPRWLRHGSRLANARLLHRQGDRPVAAWLPPAIAETLASPGTGTVGALRTTLGIDPEVVCAAAARGALAIDIGSGPLSDATTVRVPRRGARSGAYDTSDEGGF